MAKDIEVKDGAKISHRMYKNRVALSDEVKTKVVDEMNRTLAASLDTYSQAKFAHWNVKGLNFYQLHLVFDTVAKVAVNGTDHLTALADSLGKYCGLMREVSSNIDDLGDKPSADFFNQLIVDAEEELYFLESHMEAGNVQ